MAFPPMLRGGGQYRTEPDPDEQELSAQIDPQSITDPSGQMPTKVPMTFIIVNGRRIEVPAGDEGGDELDQTIPPKPELKPPPPVERPPVLTNPMSVLGSTGAATGKALGSLIDQPGNLPAAMKAFGQELPHAATASSVSDLTSPSQELRRRGVDVGTVPSLMMDVSLDPQNLVGGEPITDIGKVGVAAAMALPEGAQLLKGLASRLVTNVLPLIPEKGWAADRILSKISSGIASKDELAATGIGEWLKSFGGKPVTRGQFEQTVQEKGLPLYERWYGSDPETDVLKNRLAVADEEVNSIRYQFGNQLGNSLLAASERADGRMLTPDEIRAAIIEKFPSFSNPEQRASLDNYVDLGTKYLEARTKVNAIREQIAARGPQMAEPKWGSSYSLPGGTNWRELTIGLSPDAPSGPPHVEPDASWKVSPYNVTSVHKYEDPNMLTHVRMGDYVTDDGRKVLVINEGQSDAHSAARETHEGYIDEILRNRGKHTEVDNLGLTAKEQLAKDLVKDDPQEVAALSKQGYGTKNTSQLIRGRESVPDIPFKGSGWQNLFMKRIVAYAAEHGYDEVAWTTGMQQSERYNKALRDITKIQMTPEGYVQVFRNNETYPVHSFGPFKHPSEAAHAIGVDSARRLAAIPQKDNVWKYNVVDAKGNTITWREFPTEEEAYAQRVIDQETYHPADRPPVPASWWVLSYEDQARAENHWKEHLVTDLDAHKAKAQAVVDRKIDYDAETRAVARTNRSSKAAINRLNLPDSDVDIPDLDWQTFREMPDVPADDRQPTFGERAGASQRDVRGYAPRGDTQPSYTVRDAILSTAKAHGINLDPDSLSYAVRGHEDVIRGRTYQHGYFGSDVLPAVDPSVLQTVDGRPLSIHDRYLVEDAAKDAFAGVNRYKEEVEGAIKKKYQAQLKDYKQEYIDEIKNSDVYKERFDQALARRLNNEWYSIDQEDRLQIARDLGIESAFDPKPKELRPDTGDVGDVQPPDKSRELDLRTDPLTISSKGMEQEYDKSLVDIASALGKKYGVRPRRLEIQTAGRQQGGYSYNRPIKGPLRVEQKGLGTGLSQYGDVYFEVLGGDDASIDRFYAQGSTPEDIAQAEAKAHAAVKRLKDDRTVWALPMTPEMREGVKKTPFPLMAALPPTIGTYIWLKSGERVRVTKTYDDGSFDAEPSKGPKVIKQ